MAIVLLGPIVTDIRGKIGGSVFSKSSAGNTVRRLVRPHNPQTAAQTLARSRMTEAMTTFKNMSAAQQLNWKNYGTTINLSNRLGQTFHPTGSQLFAQLATNFRQMNATAAIPTAPPVTEFTGDTLVFTFASSGSNIVATKVPAANASVAGSTVEFMYQLLPTNGRSPQEKKWKTASFKSFLAADLTLNIAVPITTLGTRYAIAYRFGKTATGQKTDIVSAGIVVMT